MKSKFKEYFGINEAKINVPADKLDDPDVQKLINNSNSDETEINVTEQDLEEAKLINNMTDYRGGVQYMLYDPAMAQNVATEIRNFATKKKIYVIDYKQSKDGRFGYFHFRIGDDPAKESQQIQGYISSKPEIKHFRFKILEDKSRKKRINKNQ